MARVARSRLPQRTRLRRNDILLGTEIGDVPFVVCGDGGHNVNALVRAQRGHPGQEPYSGSDVTYLEGKHPVPEVKQLRLEKFDDHSYGYLRIHVDQQELKIGFHQVGVRSLAQSRFDMVTVKLDEHIMVAN